MTTPIAHIPKPEAEQYESSRKLLLVPAYIFAPDAPEDGQQVLERYWSEVRDQIDGLERSLGKVAHVYHEALVEDGEAGMKMLDEMNPKGGPFIQAMCQSDAQLEATEDRALMEESADWQRCITVGLMSEAVRSAAFEGYQHATRGRFEHIASRIDETLKESEVGALFIREDHSVQFPSDVQVFYVAPPALDALKRWIEDQVRAVAETLDKQQQPDEDEAAS